MHNFKISTCVFLIFSLCPSRYRLPRWPCCVTPVAPKFYVWITFPPVPGQSPRAGLLEVPCHEVNSSSRLLPASSHLGCPISCGKFLFPSPYLPVPILDVPISCGKFLFPSPYLPVHILDVPSPVVNSSSHLPTCQFPSWMSHLLW